MFALTDQKSIVGFVYLFICRMFAVGDLLRQESDRQIELADSSRSGLARKKVLRRRRTSDRGGSKRPSVTDHTHGASSKQVTPVKRAPFRGVFLGSSHTNMNEFVYFSSYESKELKQHGANYTGMSLFLSFAFYSHK